MLTLEIDTGAHTEDIDEVHVYVAHPAPPEDHDTDAERCEYATNELRALLSLECGCDYGPAPDEPGPRHPEHWPNRIGAQLYLGGFVRGFQEELRDYAHECITATLEAFDGTFAGLKLAWED